MELYKEDPQVIARAFNRDPFYSYLTRQLFAHVDLSKPGRMLDLGCGTGRNAFVAGRRGYEVLGIDSEPKAIEIASQIARDQNLERNVKFLQADLSGLSPEQFGVFDYCIATEVIEHIDDFQKVIDFAYSSLKDGGILLLSTPNDPKQWTVLDDHARHVRRFQIDELQNALSRFGTVQIKTAGFPLHRFSMWLYHQWVRRSWGTHRPTVFRRNAVVGLLYYWLGSCVMEFDHVFDFTPWGSTLLAVAKK